MLASSTTISLLDLGVAINVVGILAPAVISAFVARKYDQAHFRYWTFNMLTLAAAVLLLGVHSVATQTWHLEPGDLREPLAETAAQGRASYREAGVRLEVTLPEAPLWAAHDAHRLYQVVSNPLGNAVKFTPSGGEVTLAARQEAGAVVITVRDTGLGIDAAHHRSIFTSFYQVDGTSTRAASGAELGVAIVEKGHGGSISVESAAGAGSTFQVRLPGASPLAPVA